MRIPIKDDQLDISEFRSRLKLSGILVLILAGLLLARFFYLQVSSYQHYHTLAESNRIALLPEVPQRGRILDRKHRVLAENFPVYTLEITPSKVPDLTTTILELSALVAISATDRQHFYKLREASHDYESIPIRTHLSDLEVARFSVNTYRFPGVIIKSKLYRHYPYGKLGSHVIGYIGRINDKDRTSLQSRGLASNYKGSEYIGKAGIEQYYEQNLHGQTGFLQLEANANGQAVREMQRVPAIAGHDIILSLDSDLQEVAERAFGKYRGALVAIQPQSGEILAYVSMPTLDPNLFVDGIDTDSWLELNESADKPLINRPLRGIYPPGSTFKPFVALAGLHANLRYPPYAIQDTGHFSVGNNGHRYRDWKPTGHGTVDMQKAITVSCDTFFYGLAQELGITKLSNFVANFGFGKKTGIDMLGEAQGLLPTPEWKWRRFKQPWYQGETVITGIGQGYTLVTPLQLAFATAVLANNGIAVRPHLALQISDGQTSESHPLPPTLQQRLNLNAADLALVRRGMIDVTLAGGTAAGIGQSTRYQIAGKTGTAQVVGMTRNDKAQSHRIEERHRDHALFIAYAPADAPQIALAVIVENGGHGGSTAAPIAKTVIDAYLLQRPSPDNIASPSGEIE